MPMYDRLYFVAAMTLGDNFVYSGVAHHYADRSQELHIPVETKFFKTMQCLYQDYPNIKLFSSLAPSQEKEYIEKNQLARITMCEIFFADINGVRISPLWDEQVYTHFELPFSLRYVNFRLPKHIEGSEELYQQLSGGEPYVLVHRYTGLHPDGMPIDIPGFRTAHGLPDIKIIEIKEGITDNMLQYATLIERAQEIHCAPSSFFCLVDSMFNRTRALLFYHDIRANTIMRINNDWNNRVWNIVRYTNKL